MKPQPIADAPPRAVLYLRQSIAKEESISLEIQESAGREYCRSRGYAVVAVEEDPGKTGRTWKRPGVQRVMQMIERGDADVIVLWKWSRLSRARLDWAIAVDAVESRRWPDRVGHGAYRHDDIHRPIRARDADRDGGLRVRAHRRCLARDPRTPRAQRATHLRGDRFGYVRAEKDRYEPHPQQAPLLAEAYRRYALDEHGLSRITRWWNEQGVPTARGGSWSIPVVTRILDSGFAAGRIVQMTPAGRAYHAGRQEPIISDELWDAYLRRRAAAPRPSRQVEPRSPLSGLLRCGDCGGSMRMAKRPSAGGQLAPGFVCTRWYEYRDGRRLVSCLEHRATGAVKAWVLDRATEIESLAPEVAREQRPVAAIDDSAAVARRLAKARGALGALTVRWVEGRVTEDAYTAAAARLQSEIDRLSAHAPAPAAPSITPEEMRDLAVSISELWDAATPLELRTALAAIIDHVEVIPPAEKGMGKTTFRVIPRYPELYV
ncbi:recombinase family protein [Leifsonia sp. P73]|uniref:recombinase family protein n=1 Tax=Leifsonia sp. P73 TaxID=3423959 RepID=UPI003DA3F6D8